MSSLDVGYTYTWNNQLVILENITAGSNFIKMSSTGEYMAISSRNNGIYISDNSGNSWTTSSAPTTADWNGIAMSSNGQYIAGYAGYNSSVPFNYIYLNTNYGYGDLTSNWNKIEPELICSGLAISSTGEYMAACFGGNGIYISFNHGSNWTKTFNPSSKSFSGIAMSSTGQYMAACVGNNSISEIYVSDNSGNSWTTSSAPTTEDWNGIAMSSNGQYIAATVYNGGIYIINDYGSSNSSCTKSNAPSNKWLNITMSSTGQYMVACFGSSGGKIYISYDIGSTWSQEILDSAISDWSSITMSSTGQYIAAAYQPTNGNDGLSIYIGTGTLPPPPPTPTPTPTPTPKPDPDPDPIITITTFPNLILAGQPATIIYYNSSYLPVIGNQYYLINQLGNTVSNVSSNFTFNNVILPAGLNILSIYNKTTGTFGPYFKIDVSTICFKEGTKILCYSKPVDRYIPIEQLTDNLFIKTYKHGYKKIKYILKSQLLNSSEKTINKLYKMSKTKQNGLIEDLYITGSHALLKQELTIKEESKMNKLLTATLKDIDYNRTIDGLTKLIACFDERFQEFNEEGMYNIYHLVLDNDCVFRNYGIYANGLLTESTDELSLRRMTDFNIIHYGYNTNTNNINNNIFNKYNTNNYSVLSKVSGKKRSKKM
jgi:hypothetical protein